MLKGELASLNYNLICQIQEKCSRKEEQTKAKRKPIKLNVGSPQHAAVRLVTRINTISFTNMDFIAEGLYFFIT